MAILNQKSPKMQSDHSLAEDEFKEDLPEKKGYMNKKSAKVFVGYQKRFFTLFKHRLCYYKSEEDAVPTGIFNFEKISAKAIANKDDPLMLVLSISGLKREFKFKCENTKDRDDWVDQINLHISDTSEMQKDPNFAKEKSFWKKTDKIDTELFQKLADSGDLLLFRGKKLSSKLARGMTS